VRLNVHHRKALRILGATAAADIVLGACFGLADHIGVPHGLYCATGFATTDGCDVSPHGGVAYLLGALMMLSLIPLVGVVWAYVTTGLTADHIDQRHGEMTNHVTTTVLGEQ
jgi:hypothetical protein